MDSQCAKMVQDLLSAQARSTAPAAAKLQPVLQGQGKNSLHIQASAAQLCPPLPAATTSVNGIPGKADGGLARLSSNGPSGATAAKGLVAEAKGSPARGLSKERTDTAGSLASLITPSINSTPAFTSQQPALGAHSPHDEHAMLRSVDWHAVLGHAAADISCLSSPVHCYLSYAVGCL